MLARDRRTLRGVRAFGLLRMTAWFCAGHRAGILQVAGSKSCAWLVQKPLEVAPERPKSTLGVPEIEPRVSGEGRKSGQERPRAAKSGPRAAQERPESVPRAAKSAPRERSWRPELPKTRQEAPKTLQVGLQRRPREVQELQNSSPSAIRQQTAPPCKNHEKHCKVLQKSRFGRTAIDGKMSLGGKLRPLLTPSWLVRVQVGAKRGMGRSQESSKSARDRPRAPQERPKSGQRAPKSAKRVSRVVGGG